MNFLAEYSDRNGLTVSVAKTKALVFQKGSQRPGLTLTFTLTYHHRGDSAAGVNASGRSLLALCKSSGMRIANGRSQGDERGELTFVSRSVGVSLRAC